MKKNYFLLTLLCVSFLGFSQEFTIDFEGTDPLSSLPTGVTHIEPTENVLAYVAESSYIFDSAGGDIIQYVSDSGAGGQIIDRAQFANTVVTDTDSSSKTFQGDYTGHIIIDENALGADDFTLRLDYKQFGHKMGSTSCGFITIVGEESTGVWKSDRITSKNGGYTSGMGLAFGGFPYGTVLPVFKNIVLTYTASDQMYRFYVDGALASTSDAAQASGEWNNRKIYLGFTGQDHNATTDHLDATTGEFTTNGLRSDGRIADLQTRMDNIQVYKKAISDADVTKLFNGGTLAVNQLSKETFKTFPNPVKDVLYFSTNTVSSVEIYNILGAKVLSQKVTNSVDMSDLKAGIYLLKATDTNNLEVKTLKVVKE